MDFVHLKLTFVVTLIDELQQPFPVFGAVFILAFIDLTIRPFLSSDSILFVVLPLSNILCPVAMSISSFSACLIIQPFSFIDITICMV